MNIYDEMEPQFYHKVAEAVGNANPILDIGCGEGRLSNFLARTLESEVCGVDISDLKLTKAREAADARDVSDLAWFVKGDASQLDFLVKLMTLLLPLLAFMFCMSS